MGTLGWIHLFTSVINVPKICAYFDQTEQKRNTATDAFKILALPKLACLLFSSIPTSCGRLTAALEFGHKVKEWLSRLERLQTNKTLQECDIRISNSNFVLRQFLKAGFPGKERESKELQGRLKTEVLMLPLHLLSLFLRTRLPWQKTCFYNFKQFLQFTKTSLSTQMFRKRNTFFAFGGQWW